MTADVRFTAVDYTVFVSMLLVSLGIGVYSSLRGKGASSTQAFLVGGREMSVAPVALSLIGGVISAISILGLPTEVYLYGTQLTTNIIGLMLGVTVVKHVFLPVIYPLKLISIYEYIELRFKSKALRMLAMSCQLIGLCVYLGSCLYAPSLAVSSVTSIPTWASVLTMGIVCAFYITIVSLIVGGDNSKGSFPPKGGVKAVVYTDVVQTLLMFGGVILVVALSCKDMGGLREVLQIANQGGRLEFFNTDPSPFVRHTLWSTIVLGLYTAFSVIGTGQSQYQRFASVKNLAMAQRLCTLFSIGVLLLWGVFYTSGLVAYAVYSGCDPLTAGKIEKPDQIIPYLVADKLSRLNGLGGLFVAAVYGGVLSSLSSQGNAIACIVWEDFLKDRPYFRDISDRSATNVVKLLSAVAGLVGIGMAFVIGNLGTINHVIYAIDGAIGGPLCGLFFIGICAPWVSTKGAIVGSLLSFTFNLWVGLGRFVIGGKGPERLPLSVDACANATLSTDLNATLSDSFSITETPPQMASHTIYDLSYCYNGVLGIALNIVISSLVSFLTGPLLPGEIRSDLVYPPCSKLYHRLCLLLRPRLEVTTEKECAEKEVTLNMLTSK
ncbi:sodium-coupled monocarboxylate transporter 1-like [Penaeus japonicus]|uniref:sodium-coupled monocarboxylate transporter 1-like n=1 Tax=Penaeus japonicus TaxID=27405 RepID=UPI001C71003C|nr:sodium-coupled monocarboxylate transporter 1-like [Penaeus japonicus]